MVHLVGMGGHKFSVGRLIGFRGPVNESTLTTASFSQPAVVYTCVYEFGNEIAWKT